MEDPSIHINRPAYTLDQYNQEYDIRPEQEESLTECMKNECQCSSKCLKETLLRRVPAVGVLANYRWKKDLVRDIISGLSVGVIHIPQGMGFALLTELPPVYGLYSSIFPVWVYFIFGTSRHISMGTMALISLMIGSVVSNQVQILMEESVGMETTTMATATQSMVATNITGFDEQYILDFKVGIATSVTLIAGVFHLLLFVLRLDVVATYMSMPFVGSFMVGAAIHIISSQLAAVLGLSIPKSAGNFSVINTLIDVFENITDTNLAALVTSIICLTFLVFIKEFVNVRYRKQLKVPIPAELLLIVAGTLISEYAKLEENFDLAVVGSIETGLPSPKVPSFHNASSYIVDSILVGVVAFAISITMAKLMSRKHGYEMDSRQELLAYGLQNVVSSFFHCFAGTQAPPRTLVHDSIGGRSQLASLFSTTLPLLVVLVLGPLFRSLPNAVLGSIVIAALLPLLKTFRDLRMYWKINIYDFIVWVVTLISVVGISIAIGLAVGIGCSILLVVIQSQLARGRLVRSNQFSDIFVPTAQLPKPTSGDDRGIRVFHFESNLFFATVDNFKSLIFELSKSPSIEIEQSTGNNIKGDSTDAKANDVTMSQATWENPVTAVVLDCSSINYVDIMGINVIKDTASEFGKQGINFALAACRSTLLATLKNAGIIAQTPGDSKTQMKIYPTIQDAVACNVTTEITVSVL